MLRKLLGVVGVSSLLIAAPLSAASAAGMPVKAPPPPPPPACTWCGWYVGGNAGYGWGSRTNPGYSLTDTSGTGYAPYVASGGFPLRALSPRGGLGGVQIGYNFQSTKWVWGLEADIQDAAINAASTVTVQPTPGSAIGTDSVSQHLNWFGTVRGRLGIAENNWLFYATGGLIYGGVHSSLTQSATNTYFATNTTNAVRGGGTAGAGVEYDFGKWSAKLEYLYYDMGRDSTTIAGTGIFTGIVYTASQRTAGSILRVGLNWHFNLGGPIYGKD
jgi:outer membrane immunogenic protein